MTDLVRAGAFVALIVLATTGAGAEDTAINVDDEGVAISGYDPVAYFHGTGAMRGEPRFEASWRDAVWRFANADNLSLFLADPERYAPQYGGWCAYALSQGQYAAEVDAREAYTVRDGKLYLNWSRRVKTRWERDVERRIATADGNWPIVEQQLLDGTARISRRRAD